MKNIYLLFIALFLTFLSHAQMVLEYEIPESGDSIALPLSGTVDVTVDWGDGSQNSFESSGFKWHVFETAGTKIVTITGSLTHFGMSNSSGNKYLVKVLSWDNLGLTDLSHAFSAAWNLTTVPHSLPEEITSLANMFRHANSFNQDISEWNTEKTTSMSNMFYYAKSFNQPIGDWNTGAVTNMSGMFYNALAFNQPIGNWNIEKVTNMSRMFYDAKSFDQDISSWNITSVTTMSWMFYGAKKFNQPIGNWNTNSVTIMDNMFYGTYAFNQALGNWDVSNVTTLYQLFYNASICTDNYDATLQGWAKQTVKKSIQFHGGYSKYSSASEVARAILAESWYMKDAGLGTTDHKKCDKVLSISSLENGELAFYPNPVSDKLYINTTSLSSYAVYSLTGNLLKEAEGSKTQIDLSDLPSGIYILQTTSELGIRNQRFSKE